MKIQSFTQGKNEPKNEDAFGYNSNIVVLSDGSTDKSGQSFSGKSGGEIISQFLVEKSLKSNLIGLELVQHLSNQVMHLYEDINPKAQSESAFRFSATLLHVHIDSEKIRITRVGDSSFRINGKDLYKNDELIDDLNAETRSLYIEKTGDVAGSRDYILPILKRQHEYQNNQESILGYGCVDGTEVPEKFVKIFEFPRAEVNIIELFSDGYFKIPDEATITAYEKAHETVEREDPDKWKIYKSTKSKDDRTVVIISDIH